MLGHLMTIDPSKGAQSRCKSSACDDLYRQSVRCSLTLVQLSWVQAHRHWDGLVHLDARGCVCMVVREERAIGLLCGSIALKGKTQSLVYSFLLHQGGVAGRCHQCRGSQTPSYQLQALVLLGPRGCSRGPFENVLAEWHSNVML